LYLFCCFFLYNGLFAQNTNLRYKWVSLNNLKSTDTLAIYSPSVRLVFPQDTSIQLIFDLNQNKIRYTGNHLPDSILVSYRVFDFNWHTNSLSKNSLEKKYLYMPKPFKKEQDLSEKKEEWFKTSKITKSGSITRGISFGNTQSVYVNAGLNLQLEGKISDNLNVVAAISDQNIPYQPEGNTQTLQQFDKVFVQLFSKDTRFSIGDIVLRNPIWDRINRSSYFLRYYKNVQGGLVENATKISSNRIINSSLAGAVAKGRFASIFVDAIEGVQGPYRLKGPANERFIIVLANSERVYVDGKLIERGFNMDYTIDYNLAEITFNPKIIITKYTRIRVDFEFSERNYSRTIFSIIHQETFKKLNFFINYYSEKDNPRNPVTLSLSDNDRQILSQAGNNIENALAPSVTELSTFDEKQVLYRKTDTLINGQIFEIYQYSTNQTDAKYQVSFSDVGSGNYILKNALTNGRVYEWIAPVNGIKQGTYEPVRLLPAPAKRQMVTLGVEYNLSQQEQLFIETAYSYKDINLLSTIGNEQNTGAAFKTGYRNNGKKISFLKRYIWIGETGIELNQQYFNPIDRFRDIDFDRDWSIRLDTVKPNQEFILNGKLGIIYSPQKDSAKVSLSKNFPLIKADRILYDFMKRIRTDEINGWQNRGIFEGSIGRLHIQGNTFFLFADQRWEQVSWQRFKSEFKYKARYVVPGYIIEVDKNRINSNAKKDSVLRTVMNFTSHTFFLQNTDTASTKFRTDYTWREDNLPVDGKTLRNTLSHTVNGSVKTILFKNQDIAFTGTYRKLENVQLKGLDEETIMGRLDWNGDFWQQNLRSQFTYNMATGRELKREFVFLPVPTGQGTHTWRDENGDGIQQLTEFYEAINSDERNYVKFFTPTDQYIKAYSQNLNYRLTANFPVEWQSENDIRAFLTKFSSVFSWTIFRKMTDEAIWKRFVPFSSVSDNQILSQQNLMRGTLFFNRTSSRFGMDFNVLHSLRKQLLTNGFETNANTEKRLNSRFNFLSAWNIKLIIAELFKTNSSDYLLNRNYQIKGWQLSPELSWQPNNDFRISGNYIFTVKKNILSDNKLSEEALLNQIGLEIRWNKLQKRSLSGMLKMIEIDFKNGETDSPVGYEMLEALRPGINWNWNLTWQQRLSNGLQLNLIYEGRQSQNQRVIQIGRVQVSALF
jgi:hypothetical protein